jgi:N-acetylglucosamine-6-phosphate deacetylase
MLKIIKNAKIVFPENIVEGSIIFSDKIKDIKARFENFNAKEIDAEGMYLTPGFIDIHIHGAGGHDTMDDNPQSVNEISKCIIKNGVTSFLPTTTTMPSDDIKRALDKIKKAVKNGTEGARVLGANVEGPFINEQYKGAQNADYIQKPQLEIIKNYFNIIKLITLAPEIEGSEKLIKKLKKSGIIISAGHSGATYEIIMEAKNWGITHITHLFNAMTGLHHRKPGIVGAALENDLNCELIADFIHVHPAVLKIVLKTKKLCELVLITDQIKAGSIGDGIYDLGNQKVIVKNGEARLEDGTLAGSVLTLDQAVRNIDSLKVLTLPQIISLVTRNPATILGLAHQVGSISIGNRADLVLIDRDLNVKKVFKDGLEVISN